MRFTLLHTSIVVAAASSLLLLHCVGDSVTPTSSGDGGGSGIDCGNLVSSLCGDSGGHTEIDGGGGGGMEAGADASDAGENNTDAGSDAGPTLKQAFMTSNTFDGLLGGGGGVAAGDARCMEAAQGKFPGRKFHAWLATQATAAKDNIKGTGPWYVGATKIGDVALFTSGGSLLTDWLTESGQPIVTFKTAWTGSSPAGGIDVNGTCNDWTSNAGADSGGVGIAGGMVGTWSYTTESTCDSTVRRLYCLEE